MRNLAALAIAATLAVAGVQARSQTTTTAKPQAGKPAESKPAQAAGGAEKGQQLYASNKCQTCHSIAGKGNAKGELDCVGTKLSAEEIRQWLINPREMTGKTNATRKPPMPPYAKLAKEDIESLVGYLQTLKCKK